MLGKKQLSPIALYKLFFLVDSPVVARISIVGSRAHNVIIFTHVVHVACAQRIQQIRVHKHWLHSKYTEVNGKRRLRCVRRSGKTRSIRSLTTCSSWVSSDSVRSSEQPIMVWRLRVDRGIHLLSLWPSKPPTGDELHIRSCSMMFIPPECVLSRQPLPRGVDSQSILFSLTAEWQ